MEEDTSRTVLVEEVGNIPLKSNIVPSEETNGTFTTSSLNNEKVEDSTFVAKISLPYEASEKSEVLEKVPNVSGEANAGAVVSSSSLSTSSSVGCSGQKPVTDSQTSGEPQTSSRPPGTNGNNNNNNNNVYKSKSKSTGPSHTSSSLVDISHKTAIESSAPLNTHGSTFTHSVPSSLSSHNQPASSPRTTEDRSRSGTKAAESSTYQWPVDQHPNKGAYVTSTEKPEESGKLTKLLPPISQNIFPGHHQENAASQRLSPSHFQRTMMNERRSPAHLQQMATSDIIHNASTLIHGPDMQGSVQSNVVERTGQPSANQGAMSLPQRGRNTNDSLKTISSPYARQDDASPAELKNYLLSPAQIKSGYPASNPAMTSVSLPTHLKGITVNANETLGMGQTLAPQQKVKPVSKPTQPSQKAKRRKSKAASTKQAKSSSFLGDDDEDNDFIPVGMVQLSSQRRPTEVNSAVEMHVGSQRPNELQQLQLQKQLEHQQQGLLPTNLLQQQQYPGAQASEAKSIQQQPPALEERKEMDSRSQQHQLLLQLVQHVQQAQQQKQILEQQQKLQQQQKQQSQFEQIQPNLATASNVKLEQFPQNQGLIIHHSQNQSYPGVSEGQMLSSEPLADRGTKKPSDHPLVHNPHPSNSTLASETSALSLTYSNLALSRASSQPLDNQTQVSTKIVAQSQNSQYSNIPKIAEQLLQRPSNDEQGYSAIESKSYSKGDDQASSKLELYFLQSRQDVSQPTAHPLPRSSPTWQAARSVTPTMVSGHHSHHHPEISRMLCSPVSPRQSASSPRASVSPRRTESPFQPSLSPCHFVSPRQPVSPHSRMVSSVVSTTSSSSKAPVASPGPLRNSPSQASNLKISLSRQNSSPRPPSSPWQPISPSQVSAPSMANFAAVQKPYPTVGQIDVSANQKHVLAGDPGPVFPSLSSSLSYQLDQNAQTSITNSQADNSEKKLLAQNDRQRNLDQAPAFNTSASMHYGQVAHSPSPPGAIGEINAPAQIPNPGRVIHHLPGEQQNSEGALSSQNYAPTSSIATSSIAASMPLAQNASPIWQQMQLQQPHKETMSTGTPQALENTKALGLIPSKPVDIRRLAQQHQQSEPHVFQQQSRYQGYSNSEANHCTQPILQQGQMKDPQAGTVFNSFSQAQSSLNNAAPSIVKAGEIREGSIDGLKHLAEKESKLIESFFPGEQVLRSEQPAVSERNKSSTQQSHDSYHESDSKTGKNTFPVFPKEVGKNEGALQVLSEIASERYVQAVAENKSRKLDHKEKDRLNTNLRDSIRPDQSPATADQEKAFKSSKMLTEAKGDGQTEESKVAAGNETPKREVRQRKPKKPFEQEETPSRRNPRASTHQKVSSDATSHKKAVSGSSPLHSQKKVLVQGKKPTGVGAKKEGEQDNKSVALKASSSSKTEPSLKRDNKSDEDASESEQDSETESNQPRRLSRRLQVKKEERQRQKSEGNSSNNDGSSQRRSKRIATCVDYKEENSDPVEEASPQYSTRSSSHQKKEPSVVTPDTKTIPSDSKTAEVGEKGSTRSRNLRKDNSKDLSAAHVADSKAETSQPKSSDGSSSDKKVAQSTLVTKTTPKTESQVSLERKMRTRNRSKSRSRSPMAAGVQDRSSPITRRNIATRQVAAAPKSATKDGPSSKRLATTEFEDSLPPWRKYPKKEGTPDSHTGQAPDDKSKKIQPEGKVKKPENTAAKKPVESNKMSKGKKGNKTPTPSKVNPLSSDKEKPDGNDLKLVSSSDIKDDTTVKQDCSSMDVSDDGSALKEDQTAAADDIKNVASQKEKSDTKPHSPSLLEKTYAELDEEVPKTDSNRSSAVTQALEKKPPGKGVSSIEQSGADRNLSLNVQNQSSELAASSLPPQPPLQSFSIEQVSSKRALSTTDRESKQDEEQHVTRLVEYKLVPVLEGETCAFAASASLVPVNGYIVPGASCDRVLLPENFMAGPAASPSMTAKILKSVVQPSAQQLVYHQHSQQSIKSQQHSTFSGPSSSVFSSLSSPSSLPKSTNGNQNQSSVSKQHNQALPVSPLRTVLSSPLHPAHPSVSPAAWSTPQQSASPNHQGQWRTTQQSHHHPRTSTETGGGTPKHTLVTATPPPPQSPHLSSSSPKIQQQPVQAPRQQQQQYQQQQASPAPSYRPSPSWNPTPPSMPSSSPQQLSSSSSSSSAWNFSSANSNPQLQQHQHQRPQQISIQAHQQQLLQHPLTQHHQMPQQSQPQHQLPMQQQHQQHRISQNQQPMQQPWISHPQPMMEEPSWRPSSSNDNSTVTAAVESWSKEFLPNPPMYNNSQQRRTSSMDLRQSSCPEPVPHLVQQPAMYSDGPSHPQAPQPSAIVSGLYAPPTSRQQQQQLPQQLESSDFSDARTDQIIQNFLRSADASGAGGGGAGGGAFGQDLTGFNLGQQDMAYLESPIRLSPNSLISAVAAAYEEDVRAGTEAHCGVGRVGDGVRDGQHPDSASMQDTINLVHTVNLEDDVPGVALGLSGLNTSQSSRSSGVVSPRPGGLDNSLLTLGERGRAGSYPDSTVDSPSLQLPESDERQEASLQALLDKKSAEANAKDMDKTESDAKPKPKDRKEQYEIVTQDGQRKFQCNQCSKVFSAGTIYRHLRTHDPDHKVECKVCGRRYTQRSSLIMHMCKSHGYIHIPRTVKKKAASASGQKEEVSLKQDEKKSVKPTKPSSVTSSKKSPGSKSGSGAKSPSGKSANDSKRQRRSSSQSPSNPLAPGLDHEEREIHKATQMQVEEQRRLKAQQKQRKAAGEGYLATAASEESSAVMDTEDTAIQPEPSALSGPENSALQPKENSSKDESIAVEPTKEKSKSKKDAKKLSKKTTEPTHLSTNKKEETQQLDANKAAKQVDISHTISDQNNMASNASAELSETRYEVSMSQSEPVENRDKERQTSSLELDELISAVASGIAGDPPAAIAKDVSSQDTDPSSRGDSTKALKENVEEKSGPESEDLFAPFIKVLENGSERFGCRLCSRTLASRNSFSLHIRRHKDEKTKVCKYCNKAFHTGQELKSHERTHTGERPYKCEICYASFSHFGSALMHKKNHAARGETEPFPVVNGEVQYPVSFKKPRANSTERTKEDSGSPKRKKGKKNSGDQSSPSVEPKQDEGNSNLSQLLRRNSLDVNLDRQQGSGDASTPNRRHSLNEQVLTGSALAKGAAASPFGSPSPSREGIGSSTQSPQAPPSYSAPYSAAPTAYEYPVPNLAPRQQGLYGTPTGYPGTSQQSQMGSSSQQNIQDNFASQKFYTPVSANDRDPNLMDMRQSQEGYFSPRHQQQPFDYQTSQPNMGYPQPSLQHHQEPPPVYRPAVSGGTDNRDGGVQQTFKSNSPSTEIVKSLLQHYNLADLHPGGDYGHQPSHLQGRPGYGHEGSPLAYSKEHQGVAPPMSYPQGQKRASGVNYKDLNPKDLNPPPYNESMQGQQQQQQHQQQFYSPQHHPYQQPPVYPSGAMLDRSIHFSPPLQKAQQQQSPQHQMLSQSQQQQQPTMQNLPGSPHYHQQQQQQPSAPVEAIQGSYQPLQPGTSHHQKTYPEIPNSTPSGFSQAAHNLQPLPKISSLTRDLPRSNTQS